MAVVVIAEAGVNHNGDVANAVKLIDAAVDSGADMVKFQTFSASDLTTEFAPKADYQNQNDGVGTQQSMLQRLQLSKQDHIALKNHCLARNIHFLSTAFGHEELGFLIELGIPAIKVPSGEITHLPLLEVMAEQALKNSLPVYLSTGMSNLAEVEDALQVFLSIGVPRKQVTLMHCLSAYPAPSAEVNLNAIKTLSDAFQCPVGYSDHTLGITAPIAAVALGASVIEKHITIDRGLPGPDHKASLEPHEFAAMVKAIRDTDTLLGSGIKHPQASELDTRCVARRSVRAACFIQSGTVIEKYHLLCQRPGDGISPMTIPSLLGKKTNCSYQPGDLIVNDPFI